jgi:hypothetical protein
LTRAIAAVGLTAAAIVACASTPDLRQGADRVQIGKADPDPNRYAAIGPIEVRHGAALVKGTYEGAYAELQNTAAEKGADYVEILDVREGYRGDLAFVIRGVMFKLKSSAPPASTAAK